MTPRTGSPGVRGGLTVAVPDGRVAVWEHGAGPALVLVHSGTATAAHDWSGLCDDLARDHRVVLLDQRGHGASPNQGGELSLRRFAADLPHVLRRLGIDRAVFVAASMGASAVLHLLVRRPGLGRAAVLIGAAATGDAARVRAMATSPWWPDTLRGLRHDVNPSAGYWDDLRGVLLEDWACNAEVATAALARIDCPVLVVRGDGDRVQTDGVTRHLAAHLPHARLVTLLGAGHAAQLDQPERFLGLVREFLAELAPVAP